MLDLEQYSTYLLLYCDRLKESSPPACTWPGKAAPGRRPVPGSRGGAAPSVPAWQSPTAGTRPAPPAPACRNRARWTLCDQMQTCGRTEPLAPLLHEKCMHARCSWRNNEQKAATRAIAGKVQHPHVCKWPERQLLWLLDLCHQAAAGVCHFALDGFLQLEGVRLHAKGTQACGCS